MDNIEGFFRALANSMPEGEHRTYPVTVWHSGAVTIEVPVILPDTNTTRTGKEANDG